MSSHSHIPFSFSLLSSSTSSKRKQTETEDLISNLNSLIPPPKKATNFNETKVEEDIPEWVAKLAFKKGATFASKVMEKQIYASDASDQQNRFMIRKRVAEDRLMPAMTREEVVASNLPTACGSKTSKRRRLCVGEEEASERLNGREHGGLEVMVYNRIGWGCFLYLTKWDASKASVIKGGNYREFYRRSYFAAGDKVEMWTFRDGDGKMCFAIGNKIDLEISL